MSVKDFQQTTALGPDALFMLEGATFDTSPGGRHKPKQIVVNALPLTKIPVAMRKMGWHTSAALMQRWFDSPGWEMPEAWKTHNGQPAPLGLSNAQYDEGIVKMSWAMGYERCQAAVKEAESRLATPNAVQRLRNLLGRLGWKEGVLLIWVQFRTQRERWTHSPSSISQPLEVRRIHLMICMEHWVEPH